MLKLHQASSIMQSLIMRQRTQIESLISNSWAKNELLRFEFRFMKAESTNVYTAHICMIYINIK